VGQARARLQKAQAGGTQRGSAPAARDGALSSEGDFDGAAPHHSATGRVLADAAAEAQRVLAACQDWDCLGLDAGAPQVRRAVVTFLSPNRSDRSKSCHGDFRTLLCQAGGMALTVTVKMVLLRRAYCSSIRCPLAHCREQEN
jgi:hypothetical protein